MWLLLNSAGRCSAICDHTGSRRRAERRTAEAVVGVLQLVGRRRRATRPSGRRRRAGRRRRRGRGRRRRRRRARRTASRPRAASLAAVGLADHVAQPEHRPHRVADGVVEVLGGLALVGRFVLGHGFILPRAAKAASDLGRGQLRGRDAGRDAQPVVRRTADREPAGRRRPPRGCRATRSRWPTAYCGSAPPHRCTCASTGRTERPTASARSRQRELDELVVGALEQLLLAVPADRAAQHQRRRRPARRRAPSPTWRTRTSPPSPTRPSTGGTRKPDPGTSGRSRARNARVTIAIEAYSIRASSRAASAPRRRAAGAVGRAGVARTTASACSTSASRVGPDDELPAASVARARSRTVAPVRTSSAGRGERPRRAAGRRRRRAPRRPGRRTSPCHAALVGRCPHQSRPVRGRAAPRAWGTAARAEISRAWPAYTPPSSGSTSRSTTSRPSRSSTSQPTLTSCPSSAGRREHARPAAARARPGGATARRCRPARRASAGPPSACAASAAVAPRDQRFALVVAGCTMSSSSPTPGPGRRPRVGGRASPRRRRRR